MDTQHVFFRPSKIDSMDHLNPLPMALYMKYAPRRRGVLSIDQGTVADQSCAVVKNFASRILPSERTVKVF